MRAPAARVCLNHLGVGVWLTLTLAASPVAAQTAAPSGGPAAQDGFRLILARGRDVLLQGAPPDAASVRGWLAALGPDGRWPDIDYADQERGAWKTGRHLDRVKALARALADPRSPVHDDPALEAGLMRALDDWTAHRYHNPNWWHNDIGVPGNMRDIILLLGGRLTGDRRIGALAVLHQLGPARPGGGANTVWEADLGLDYGALTGDEVLVARQSGLIAGEIVIGDRREGIQSDYSFHQHGAHLQQFSYGGAFLADTSRLGWQLRGTPWAIPPEKMRLLADYVLEGSQWMVRGMSTVPGTVDRSASRPNSLGGDLRTAARYLREAVPSRAAALGALLARQEGRGAPLTGFRAFPRSDFAAYHRPAFSFFLKTVSDRTLMTETGLNGDNLKGQKLNCGDGYFLRDGSEYTNLQPLWDWDLLPGVTWGKGAGEVIRRPFVGSVDDGVAGATAMDYQFGSKQAPLLTARKFWACDGDAVVCLIGGLSAPGVSSPVQTALDQCLRRGPVTVAGTDGMVKTLPDGAYPAQPLRWVHHAGLLYIPIGARPVSLQLGPVTGTWAQIGRGQSPISVRASLFLPVLDHGTAPVDQASGFVVLPCATPKQAARLAARPGWHVLRNDTACQAVGFDNGDWMAAFYQPGQLSRDGRLLLRVGQPCLVLQRGGVLHASDPTQTGGMAVMTRAGSALQLALPPGGRASAPVR